MVGCVCTNVDRTPRNTNLLIWHRELWLIDHGAALYFHHSWDNYLERSRDSFRAIKDHVLLPLASELQGADEELAAKLTLELLAEIVALIPDEWLGDVDAFTDVAAHRRAYLDYFLTRLEAPRAFVKEAVDARMHFEYSIIRVVPRVEREEFMNVGVVVPVRFRIF